MPQTEAAFHLNGGVIPASVPIGKFLTGVLCIGSGHSLGREGPSVQPTAIYHALLHQDGVHLPSAEAKVRGSGRTARDLLDGDLPTVDAAATLDQAWALLDTSSAREYS